MLDAPYHERVATPEQDDVDRIVAAWERERPDLDHSPLRVLSRVSRLGRRLDHIRGAAFSGHGLETWEFDVLAALRRAGRPYRLSPGRLTAETMVTSGTMTNRVDRLEARGYVRRRPSATDRRSVHVELTASGQEVVDAAMADLLHREAELLAELPAQDQAALADALRRLMISLPG